MTVSDNTIQAEGLRSFFKFWGKVSAEAGIKLATNVRKLQAESWKSEQMLLVQLVLELQKKIIKTTCSDQLLAHSQKVLSGKI